MWRDVKILSITFDRQISQFSNLYLFLPHEIFFLDYHQLQSTCTHFPLLCCPLLLFLFQNQVNKALSWLMGLPINFLLLLCPGLIKLMLLPTSDFESSSWGTYIAARVAAGERLEIDGAEELREEGRWAHTLSCMGCRGYAWVTNVSSSRLHNSVPCTLSTGIRNIERALARRNSV